MADVALAWYSMSDDAVTANRAQVRRWAEELGLPTSRLTKANNVLLFRQAAREVRIPFRNDDLDWELFAEATRATDNYELHTLFARPPQGKLRRLGEVKLFMTRRTAAGMVAGSERLKSLTAASASASESVAVQEWLATFGHRFEELQGLAPQTTIRAIVRDHLLGHAIPLGPHKVGMYYVYVEHLPRVARLREFLERCAHNSSFITLPIEAGPEQHRVFADAADDHMESQVDRWESAMMMSYDRQPAGRLADPKMWWDRLSSLQDLIAGHEQRLGWALVKARSRVEAGRSTLHRIVPSADLQRVIT